MHKYQPEGGYVPIEAESPLYGPMIEKIAVFAVPVSQVVGRIKLGQHRSPEYVAAVVDGLLRRGGPGDVEAIEAILTQVTDTHMTGSVRPSWLRGPGGTTLHVALGEADVAGAVDLVTGEYWNVDVSREQLALACRRSSAWIGAKDPTGKLVATARAISDGSKFGWIGDVAVAQAFRGQGLGTALIELLLKHPTLRHVRRSCLRTADAHGFYRRMGFVDGDVEREAQRAAKRGFVASTWMVRSGPDAAKPED